MTPVPKAALQKLPKPFCVCTFGACERICSYIWQRWEHRADIHLPSQPRFQLPHRFLGGEANSADIRPRRAARGVLLEQTSCRYAKLILSQQSKDLDHPRGRQRQGPAAHPEIWIEEGPTAHLEIWIEEGLTAHPEIWIEEGPTAHPEIRIEEGPTAHPEIWIEEGPTAHLEIRIEEGAVSSPGDPD
ncbi:hypothetical protein P7K49_020645 [Saguinus oedipus]|uniref:Uncharacterized protein n=1 Tax=Saguinus oedipus TaxID=9490 RepID=A0ABQ9V0Q9_SAGOE|nr:hypothetical protein P7K49_020645 [Saguinus oedipus]